MILPGVPEQKIGRQYQAQPGLGAAAGSRLGALDGLRFVAVVAVMAYHGGIWPARRGGFVGVDVFFALSGFLITSLLAGELCRTGRLRLGRFWWRRAWRLLPALAVMVTAVVAYVRLVAPPGRWPGLGADVASVALYVSNWHFVAVDSNYFAASGSASLLTHTWSLAIEEQFYLLWPLVLLGLWRVAGGQAERFRHLALATSMVGAVGSAAEMAYLYLDGASPSRLYYGTDTHASTLLIGAATALALTNPTRPRPSALVALTSGLGGLGVIAVAASWLSGNSGLTYMGGLPVVGLATCAVIVSVVSAPCGPISKVLSLPPAQAVGRISYGMYLWYFPVFAVVTHASVGLVGWPLFSLRVGADLAAASASWVLVERPAAAAARRPQATRLAQPLATLAGCVGTCGLILALGASVPVAASVPLAKVRLDGPPQAPLRLLIAGDSTALTLGLDLDQPPVPADYLVQIQDQATLGCGVVVSYRLLDHDQALRPPEECNSASSASELWPARLAQAVQQIRPQLVLVAAGRWETMDRQARPSGPWLNITDRADYDYVVSQLELAVRVASAEGAKVALATAPCFDSGEQPDGRPWPEDSPARLRAYDQAVRQAAQALPTEAFVVDLGGMVCPGGRYAQSVDGLTLRAPDGVHYPFFSLAHPDSADPDTQAQAGAFGRWIAPRLFGALRAGLAKALATPRTAPALRSPP